MTIQGGYVLLARKINMSELMHWPPLHMKLWVWMLTNANRKKGRGKLGIGQLHTSIHEMQEAMSYFVGYRKMTPTKGQIRNSYEALAKHTMIDTTKSTRGMVVTILNFEKYQNPKNYEQHSEQHDDRAANNTPTTQDRQEEQEETRGIENTYSPSGNGDSAKFTSQPFYLTRKKRKLTGPALQFFEQFWEAFNFKKAKPEAADAWLDLKNAGVITSSKIVTEEILPAARREAQNRPNVIAQGRTPKYPQGWLSGRRWEDDPEAEQQRAKLPTDW